MKKLIPVLFIAAIITIGFASWDVAETPPVTVQEELDLDFPEDVMAILETSCFDCHTSESKNDKAKTKLNFSKWSNLKTSKKIGKLDAICEEVQEGTMPTEKYLDYYPDRALNEEQVKIICNWVESEAEKLMGE
jgi:hypothetical protein